MQSHGQSSLGWLVVEISVVVLGFSVQLLGIRQLLSGMRPIMLHSTRLFSLVSHEEHSSKLNCGQKCLEIWY